MANILTGGNKVPERLINFNVYAESGTLYGVADLELPELETISDTVSGAGIAGELESPTLGHYGSMSMTINFRTPTKAVLELTAPHMHVLDCRGSIQITDAATGVITTESIRVSVQVRTKTSSLGSFEAGATTDTSIEFEVYRIAVTIGNIPAIVIDKLNFIAMFYGVDYLAEVRKDMGLN